MDKDLHRYVQPMTGRVYTIVWNESKHGPPPDRIYEDERGVWHSCGNNGKWPMYERKEPPHA